MIIELDDVSIEDVLREPFMVGTHNLVVIPSNSQGFYGAGIAKIVRLGVPKLESAAQAAFKMDPFVTSAQCLQTAMTDHQDITIVTMPTKTFWSQPESSLGNITKQLMLIGQWVQDRTYPVIMPKVGCGLGGLDWDTQVRPIVEQIARDFSITFIIVDKKVDMGTVKPGLGVGCVVYDFSSIVLSYTKPDRQPFPSYFRSVYHDFTVEGDLRGLYENRNTSEALIRQNSWTHYNNFDSFPFDDKDARIDEIMRYRINLDTHHIIRSAFMGYNVAHSTATTHKLNY